LNSAVYGKTKMYQLMLVFSKQTKPLRHIAKPLKHITTCCFSIPLGDVRRQAPLAAPTPIGRPPGTTTLHNPWGTPLATTTTTGRQLRGTTTLAALAGATRSNYDHRATTLDHHLLDNPWQALLATTTTTGRRPWTTTPRATFGGHPWQQLQQLGDHLGLRALGNHWQGPRAATTTTGRPTLTTTS